MSLKILRGVVGCGEQKVKLSKEQKSKIFKYTLRKVLPFLKKIEQEQKEELEVERKIQGMYPLVIAVIRSTRD